MDLSAARLDFTLPAGWWCLELIDGLDLADQLGSPGATAEITRSALDSARWLRDQGASIALLRPGTPQQPAALCGGVFVTEPTAGVEAYQALDAAGEAVALGDLGGIPIISHIRPVAVDHESTGSAVQISYLICPPSMCIVIIFVARECGDRKGVVDEVAKIVSAVRVVHSDAGCPV